MVNVKQSLKDQVKTARGWKTVFGLSNQGIAQAWFNRPSDKKKRLVYTHITTD